MKAIVLLTVFAALAGVGTAENVICYFASWTIYRPDNGKFTAADVDPNLCTHILFSFVGLGENGEVNLLDDWEANGLHEIENLKNLKQINPNLKISVSMGGWNEGSEKYSRLTKNPGLRANLVNNVISFLDKYGFDGFDLDWEYPNQRGGTQEDVQNFVSLLSELKAALSPRNKLLSIAVACGIASADLSYDYNRVVDNVDIVNLMCYDFHGAFEPFVGHYAPLYASNLDVTDAQKELNVAAGLNHWVNQGVNRNKLHLGLGTYARCFTLADPNNSQLYAPTYGGCEAGPYTRQMGVLGYNEICSLYPNWQEVWDDQQQVPHKVNGNQWIGYDDARSLQLKVQFGRSLGVGGFMVWSLDTDDFRGLCGAGKYPLLNAIKNA